MVTDAPFWAAAMAAVSPAGPAPMMHMGQVAMRALYAHRAEGCRVRLYAGRGQGRR